MASTATQQETRTRSGIPGLVNNPWKQQDQRIQFPRLERDANFEVVVIGAGVVGLTAALALAKAGKKVGVLEGRVVAAGQAGRAPGDVTTGNPVTYQGLEKMYGADKARLVAESQAAALAHVKRVVQEERIQCSLREVDGYIIPDQAAHADFGGELGAMHKAGLADTAQVDLEGDKTAGGARVCLQMPNQVRLNPVEYLNGLAGAVMSHGGEIFESTRVRKYDNHSLTTYEGRKVAASGAVVVATGVPITSNLVDSAIHAIALHGKQVVRRRFAVGLKVPKGAVRDAIFYDTASPPHTIHLAEGGRDHDVLIVSGQDTDQGKKPSEYGDPFRLLEGYAREKWPEVQERLYQWSHPITVPVEKLGMYGPDPVHPWGNIYVGTGDCGLVLTGGTLGGLTIADAILGRADPFAELYSPRRKLKGLPFIPTLHPAYLKNTVQSIVNLVTPQLSNPDIEDMAPDSGATIQSGLRKVAVYKDPQGETHAYSAVCPHLGCLLQWNPADKEWNCPCHGSCFDKQGSNIEGPSTLDLKELSGVLPKSKHN
ncbi:hypothetical protein WJX72_005142 [[Myrmecia] bisecta]|uniref:Rieske domain-containing protein n=1 Tax=[Myrmecia] bisecta TaxID=41462 RepID=A0AAW1PDL7_9CHLO